MNSTIIKEIKQKFFSFRNGIVAERLRESPGYSNYNVIFGLMIPQIAEIAASLTPEMELAQKLWRDDKVRESRLLATYLFPIDEVSPEFALFLASQAANSEEADMLAFRIFKRLPFASELLENMKDSKVIPDFVVKAFAAHLQ